MSYKINTTSIAKPTDGGWQKRDEVGIDTAGHPIYPAVRSYELRWNLMPLTDYQTLWNLYSTVSVTGTCTVDLPQFNGSTWTFRTYSGCVLKEPEFGKYFEENMEDVYLLIDNVRTA